MIKTIMSKSMLFTDESPLIYPDADLFGSIVGEIPWMSVVSMDS